MKSALCIALTVCFTVFSPSPEAARADDALDQYKLGEAHYERKRWTLAVDELKAFLKANPDHARAARGRLMLGLALVNLEKYSEARDEMRTYVKKHPQNRNLPYAMYRVGECSYFLNDFKQAASELEAFVRKYPKHDLDEYALYYLGDSQLRIGDAREAAKNLSTTLDRHPKGRFTEDARFRLAQAYEQSKDLQRAVDLYERIAADDKGLYAPQSQMNLGALYFAADRFADAASEFTQFASRFPEHDEAPVAALNAGFAYVNLSQHDKAVEQFRKTAKAEKHAGAAGYWEGVSLLQLGRNADAARALEDAWTLNGSGPLAEDNLYQLATAEYRLKKYDDAGARFQTLIDRFPRSDKADDGLYFAGEAALRAGNLEEARQRVSRFENDFPKSPLRMRVELLSARIDEAAGGDEAVRKAVAKYRRVLNDSRIPDTQALARMHLTGSLQKLNEHGDALDVIFPLVERVRREGASTEFAEALVLAGNSYIIVKKYSAAGRAAADYLTLRPQGEQADQAYAIRAEAAAATGDRKQADADLDALEKQHPDSGLVQLTTHRLAEAAWDQQEYDWAAELYDELIAQGKDSPYYAAGLSGAAWSRFELGQFAEAADYFSRVVNDVPDDAVRAPEAAYMKAQSLQQAGKSKEAAAAYTTAFTSLAPEEPPPRGAEQKKGRDYYAYRAGLQAARLHVKADDVKQSDAAYEQLVERYANVENLDRLFDEWALLNYEAGNYDRSDEIFKMLIKARPESDLADNAKLSLAESDYIAGRTKDAAKAFDLLQNSSTSDAGVQERSVFQLMNIFVEREDWKKVEAASAVLLDRFKESRYTPDARLHLAEARMNQGDARSAVATLDKLRENPDLKSWAEKNWYPQIWVLSAEAHLRGKRYDKVVEIVEEFKRLNPDSAMTYKLDDVLGRAYKNQANFAEARKAFARVVDDSQGRRTETAARSQFFLAETYMIQKDYVNAQKEYFKVYHLYKFPEWQAPALYQIGVCDEARKQWDRAVQSYEDLLKEFPDSDRVEDARKRLQVARKMATR